MTAPDRRKVVQQIAQAHPEAFGGPDETHDARRLDLLRRFIIPALNLMDQGEWGLLRKDSQGGHIPPDVIVWRPTGEHFDVLSPTAGMWRPHGPIRSGWSWQAVDPPRDPPEPVPAPEPVHLDDWRAVVNQLEAFGTLVLRQQQQLAELAAQGQRVETLVNLIDTHVIALKLPPPPNYAGQLGPFTIVLKPQT